MADKQATLRLDVEGMSCGSCEARIEKAVGELAGVYAVTASASLSEVTVRYDPSQASVESIRQAIQRAGYQAGAGSSSAHEASPTRIAPVLRFLGLLAIVAAVFLLISVAGRGAFLPSVSQTMGYGLIFVVGLITSLHCIAMCGGIAVTQGIGKGSGSCAEEERGSPGRIARGFVPSLLYNAGRVVSYTVIGGVVGAVGSLFGLSTALKGLMPVLAGAFMLILGVRMLGIFPWLSRLRIRLPRIGGRRIGSALAGRGPFLVGLLNGLMPCGPLQTMQVYALGTGSFLAGALSMFLFSLGTVPLMLGFGAISSLLSARFNKWMVRASAVLVMALGLVMFGRGLNLFGVSLPAMLMPPGAAGAFPPGAAGAVPRLGGQAEVAPGGTAVARIADGYQTVTTSVESGQYQPFVVQKGVPVRWTIMANAEDLNGCNNPLTVPRYGIRKQLVPGRNLIEFTPQEEGTIVYTCWMGMISSEIRVVADVAQMTPGRNAPLAPGNLSEGDLSAGGAPATGSPSVGCCGVSSANGRFAGRNAPAAPGGKIPTALIVPARLQDGVQVVEVRVDDDGYTPAVIVLQRGVKAKIRFAPAALSACNSVVRFPAYNGSLDLARGALETPFLDVQADFAFQCGMGMINGYAKVVDDLLKVDLRAVRREVDTFRAAAGSPGSCCGS